MKNRRSRSNWPTHRERKCRGYLAKPSRAKKPRGRERSGTGATRLDLSRRVRASRQVRSTGHHQSRPSTATFFFFFSAFFRSLTPSSDAASSAEAKASRDEPCRKRASGVTASPASFCRLYYTRCGREQLSFFPFSFIFFCHAWFCFSDAANRGVGQGARRRQRGA